MNRSTDNAFKHSASGRPAVMLGLFVTLVAGPTRAQQSNSLTTPGAVESPTLQEQRIGASDLLNVVIYGVPNLSRPVRVSSEGDITVPMVTHPIRAEGLLPRELGPVIARSYQNSELLADPVITVTVIEYQSHPVTVSGAVKKPITFQAIGRVTLLDALARADGLSPEAGSEILVTRPALPNTTPATPALSMRVPVKELIGGSTPDLNVALVGGEEIRVPEAGKVFVVGNVHKPGAFRVEDSTETSVLKVLALSEGLMPYASKIAYVYRREGSASNKSEIPIELQKIVDRKTSDVPLQPNDILYIPDDKHRRMTMTTLDRLATFGAGTASGVLIWRR